MLVPELVLLFFSFLIITVSLLIKKFDFSIEFAISGTIVSFVSTLAIFVVRELVNNSLIIDPLAAFFKLVFLVSLLGILITSKGWLKHSKNQAEYCFLLLSATIGMMLAVSSYDMIILYISLELIGISSYLLVSWANDKKSIEGGIKYILTGCVSSAFLLYGMSLIYGLTGTTNLKEAGNILIGLGFGPMQLLAIISIFAGVCFKASLVPFHMWVADVYEGAPTPVTSFLATCSKLAGFGVIMRLLFYPLSSILFDWRTLFFIVSVASIVIGNLKAIPQKNIKRMLAYSSIAHAGYIAIGLCVFSGEGVVAILFYGVVYVIATISIFLVVSETGFENIEDYNGLWKRSPIFSILILISLSSLAGIPPFFGFFGKFWLFYSAINEGLLMLAIIGIVFSVVSVYYYFGPIKATYFGETEKEAIYLPSYIRFFSYTFIVFLVFGGLASHFILKYAVFANNMVKWI